MDQDQPEAGSVSRQVFISYKREDAAIARSLRQALRAEGVTVWWDEELRTGDSWAERIDTILAAVDAVVVLWSATSVSSDWVRHEASAGRIQGNLAHARIDDAEIPAPFQSIHVEDLSSWNGREDDPSFQRLLQAVRDIRQRRVRARRRWHLRFWAATILLVLLSVGSGWILHGSVEKKDPSALMGKPPIFLPDGGDPRDVLRERHKVRPLNEREGDRQLSELPNGIFGFGVPWIEPSSDPKLGRNPSGTAVLEVHKLPNGSVMLVGFISDEDAAKVRDTEGPAEVHLFPAASEEAVTLVGIPAHRIVEYEHKSSFRNAIYLKLAGVLSAGSMATDSKPTGDRP
jgi:hypothetical protein